MPSIDAFSLDSDRKISKGIRYIKVIIPILGVGIVLGAVILILSIVTLLKVNQKPEQIIDDGTRPKINSKSYHLSAGSTLGTSIRIDEVMSHLNELQRIATASNGTRAINTKGFNATVDYIRNYLTANTNYQVIQTFFFVRDFALARSPILISSIKGVTKQYNYSADRLTAEFYHVKYSRSVNVTDFVQLTVIQNVGCFDEDWKRTNPSPTGRVVLVKRGICPYRVKAALASEYNVKAILFYNDGTTPDHVSPIEINLAQSNTLPSLFLSFTVGQALANAAQSLPGNASIQMVIQVKDLPDFPVGNICADTPSGDITQTIVIGSHSDSKPAGPGINDNGSGSAANLALAVALARLFRTSTYTKYKYRVRFCWWGAEEAGILGSDHHVKQAKNSSVVGERLSDYLINLNYDMLGSPNYIFGIYDGRTAKNTTPVQALPGSNKITGLFRDWFVQQHLPWDYTDFSGRSDYGPFLAEGIVAGGLFSGADDMKTLEQRNRYDRMLGQGMGGIADILQDPCYHKACDSIENINVYGYEKMIGAAAYALEYLGRQENLKTWLYASGKTQ